MPDTITPPADTARTAPEPAAAALAGRPVHAFALLLVASLAALHLFGQYLAAAGGPARTAVLAACVFAAAAVSSVAGFAFSGIAMGVAGHLFGDPVLMVATLSVCSIAIQALAVLRLRRAIDPSALGPMLLAGLCGLPAGVWLLLHASAPRLTAALGVLLLVWSGYGLMRNPRWRVPASRAGNFVAGLLGGVTGGLAAFPGAAPVIWLQLQGVPKEESRALFQPYILLMQMAALGGIAAFGGGPRLAVAGGDTLATLAACAAAALAGAHVGLRHFARLTDAQFGRWVLVLLCLAGASLVLRSL